MEDKKYDIQKTLEFIKIAEELHKDESGKPLYSYTNTKYVKNDEKVEIECPIHGFFSQSPKKHKAGQGCAKCGKIRAANKIKSNREKFINDAIAVHNINGEPMFDYSEVDYKGFDIPVTIICKANNHKFEQTPTSHVNKKNGCKYCSGCYKRDTADFIARSVLIHKDEEGKPLYDYSRVNYTTTEDKVEIICKKNHIFLQTPHHHLSGHGCDYCARGVYIQNTEQLIEESKKIHGEKYNYSEAIYTGMNNHITIICPQHGKFRQVVLCHVTYGRGCIVCAQTKNGILSRKPIDEFIEEANLIHNNKFDYSRVHETYEKGTSQINVGCPSCKQFFLIKVKDHLEGNQCKNCKNKTQVIFFQFLREQYGEEIFKPEKIFEECKNKNYLPFDFYSEDMNIVIELDGRQHLEEVNIFRETLEIRQKIDFKKMFFLQNKNISLIRIFQEDVYENRYDWKNDLINTINLHMKNKYQFNIYYLSKNDNRYNDYKINYEKYLLENTVNNIDLNNDELNEFELEEN